jgi:uncharacterized membrane protein (UPF0136 family)
MANTILWIYIALLIIGGLMGFLKAGSKISLISSVIFAVLLGLFAAGIVHWAWGPEVLMIVLLLVFGMRYGKTKKFMPSGLMIVLTVAALILMFVTNRPA